jgi:hypothetical protein
LVLTLLNWHLAPKPEVEIRVATSLPLTVAVCLLPKLS